jgi:hypothetical protein
VGILPGPVIRVAAWDRTLQRVEEGAGQARYGERIRDDTVELHQRTASAHTTTRRSLYMKEFSSAFPRMGDVLASGSLQASTPETSRSAIGAPAFAGKGRPGGRGGLVALKASIERPRGEQRSPG